MGLQPGEVVLLKFPYSTPPKNKFCLCVCREGRKFFVISTDPYPWSAASSQVKIFKEELGALAHDSWLDMSTVYEIEAPRNAGLEKWPLARSAIGRILHGIGSVSTLSKKQRECIASSLSLK
jgi:hypothetical protein